MSIDLQVINDIFHKLSIRYGRDFLDRWTGMPIATVKTDWCAVLAGYGDNMEAIYWAMENLPDKPPTSTEFRAICRKAPAPQVAAEVIEAASRERIEYEVSRIGHKKATSQLLGGTDWAYELQRREARGEVLKPIQTRFYREALRLDVATGAPR